MANKRFNKQVPGYGFKRGGHVNTRRENRLEELGRVDAERARTSRGRRNLRDEKFRIRSELKRGGTVKKKDKHILKYRAGKKGKKVGPLQTIDLVGKAKGGKVQGYKDRKDESIAMRIRKKRTPAQLKASRDESYGRWGSKAKKSGKINR